MRNPSFQLILWSALLSGLSAAVLAGEDQGLKAPPKNAVAVPLNVVSLAQDPIGKPPAQFTFAVTGEGQDIHWEVQLDHFAATRHPLLIQNGKAEAGDNVALALVNGVLLQNGEMDVRFKVTSGEEDQSAGIVWRYQDPQTYYLARASAKDDSCSVYRGRKGVLKLLDTQQATIMPYTWHDLRVVFVQKNYTVFVDGELVVGGKDSSFMKAGGVGLCTLSDSVVQFDDIRVSR
jgi:hypothetical protein